MSGLSLQRRAGGRVKWRGVVNAFLEAHYPKTGGKACCALEVVLYASILFLLKCRDSGLCSATGLAISCEWLFQGVEVEKLHQQTEAGCSAYSLLRQKARSSKQKHPPGTFQVVVSGKCQRLPQRNPA